MIAHYVIEWAPENSRLRIIVSAGLQCDAASIPAALEWYLRRENILPAPLVHDWQYVLTGQIRRGVTRTATRWTISGSRPTTSGGVFSCNIHGGPAPPPTVIFFLTRISKVPVSAVSMSPTPHCHPPNLRIAPTPDGISATVHRFCDSLHFFFKYGAHRFREVAVPLQEVAHRSPSRAKGSPSGAEASPPGVEASPLDAEGLRMIARTLCSHAEASSPDVFTFQPAAVTFLRPTKAPSPDIFPFRSEMDSF